MQANRMAPPPAITEDWLREVDAAMDSRDVMTRRIPTEDREGLRDFSTILHPGEYLTAAITAGLAACVTAVAKADTSNPTWVTIALPAEADLRAANRGADRPRDRVTLQLAHGPVHVAKLDAAPARTPAPADLEIDASQSTSPSFPPRRRAAVDSLPGPARPRTYPNLAEVLTSRNRSHTDPGTALVRAESDAVLCAQGMLGRFLACVREQSIHDLARSMQTRLLLEQRRQEEGRRILRYSWDLFAAIWIFQLADPSNLDRKHVFQLI
eukprot:5225390-Pyramimonas_sp.AAC.1